MGAGLQFPEVFVGVSSADPADVNTVDVWTDLAIRTWRIRQAQSGKQYELGQSTAGRMQAQFRNVDEYLNPLNTTSPIYAYAKPFRQTRFMGSYPAGSTANMWNIVAGQDPSFESNSAGVLPSWLTAVGATSPAVQVANPHGGTKSVQYAVAGTTTPQGVATTPQPCLPGRVHTMSGWVRQSSASTQQIAVGGLTAADRFNRTALLGGSTADQGGTWAVTGTAADYNTVAATVPQVNGTATVSLGSTTVRWATLGVSAQDYDARSWVRVPVVATGNPVSPGLTGSFIDVNNNYRFEIVCNTNGTVDAVIAKTVAGVGTNIATVTGVANYVAGSQFWVRAQKVGTTLQLKVWQYGLFEPAAWTATVVDSSLTAAGQLGYEDKLYSGNTNTTPVLMVHGPLAVTAYTTPGTTTATTGAYVQLSVTFTATQPTHYCQWSTIGTAVAGTVNIDDVQWNQGNVVTAFSTSGPLVRGIWGGHVERLPVSWVPGTNGYEGTVDAPCVGDLAAMARTKIRTDAVTAHLQLNPTIFYPLWDGVSASGFADISGSGAAPLVEASAGPPSTVTAGSSLGLAGDPGGSGVQWGTGASAQQGTCLVSSIFNSVTIGSNQFPQGISMSMWLLPDVSTNNAGWPLTFASRDGHFQITIELATNGTFSPLTQFQASFPGPGIFASIAQSYEKDRKPHLFTGTLAVDTTNATCRLYVDGVQVGIQTLSTVAAFGTSTPDLRTGWVLVGGQTVDALNFGASIYMSTIGLVAGWNRALTAAEVLSLYRAGAGHVGETSGARVLRMLNAYHPDPSPVIDLNTMSQMGPPTATDQTSLLSALQRVQDTESGRLFENRDGATQFDGREIQYLRTVSVATFGPNIAGGQIPFTEKGGPPVFDNDTTNMYNQAVITRSGGIKAIASPDTTGSALSFYDSEYDLTVDCLTDAEATDHGNMIVANYQQPKSRVRSLTVDLGAVPALFPSVMNLEKGYRVTVNWTALAGNGGAGVSMISDYFIENINHHDIDPEAGSWLVDFQMSPAPLQPWILGDATYGQLGITTVLGF